MRIDQARTEDIDQIVELDSLVIGDAHRRPLITAMVEGHLGYGARQHDQMVGLLLSHRYFFSQPFIELLIVHPDFRRQGIGRALMCQIEQVYAPGKLFTSTNVSNERMRHLCERLGYMRSGLIEHLDEGDPELVYFKQLPEKAIRKALAGRK